MRLAANADSNQPEIVKQLRSVGVSVQCLHSMGKGVPDLLCGFRGKNALLELKDGSKPPSAQRLTTDERDWHAKWAGQVAVVSTFTEAMDSILEQCK
jgi:hypothetical protein